MVFLAPRTGAGACPLRLRPGDLGIYLSRPPHPPVSPRNCPHLPSSPRRGPVYGGGAARPPAAAGRADRERRRRSFPAGERSGVGVVGKPFLSGDKSNPPYPPPCQGGMKRRHPPRWKGFCSFLSLRQGGYEKAMRFHRAEGVLIFLAPLTRGGRGGWFFSVPGQPRRAGQPRGGACPATEPSRRFSRSPSPGGFFPPGAARMDTGARRK